MLSAHDQGVIVEAWVVPNASRDEITGEHDGALRIRTTAPAEGGKANRAIARLVGDAIGGGRSEVIAGAASRRKRVLVEGVTLEEARRSIDALLADS